MRESIKQLTLAPRSIGRRGLTALVIGLTSAAVALLAANVPPLSGSMREIDWAFYDAFYKRRTPESRQDAPVIIIAVDQGSIDHMSAAIQQSFPWPRACWGQLAAYLQKCGARAVAFDLKFDQPSKYNNESDDDKVFAAALDELSLPVISAVDVNPVPVFAPPVTHPPRFGAVNVIDARMVRTYAPFVGDEPSLAVQTVRAVGGTIPAWANQTFLLHYYGPNKRGDGRTTFRYLPAYQCVMLAQPDAPAKIQDLSADTFRGKIVLVGATASAQYDVKSSPYTDIFPGVETHATAICNILENRRVQILGAATTFGMGFLAALVAAGGSVIPRSAWIKLLVTPLAIGSAFEAGYLLFVQGANIYWLRMGMPLLACILATVGGLAWTYLVEDRQRRVLRKFLSQYVSPEVAERLDRMGTISLGGVRREMSLLFTDIAGFTDLSEQMESDQLEKFMNFYLSEMSAVVFACNGTLDKYIGDAIMSFWNAPLDQPDHAVRACRAALGMQQRENEIRPRLAELGAGNVHTRIGVNTGLANVGNYGSLQKLNYTVLGDSVNLASRLEGANKIYGSRILVAQPTMELAKDHFLFRQLDLLRVKGKKKPMAVYELLAEGSGDEREQQIARVFEAAFAAYQKQDWNSAEQILVALGRAFPDDGPTAVFLKRVRGFCDSPPPADWDGVHIAIDK